MEGTDKQQLNEISSTPSTSPEPYSDPSTSDSRQSPNIFQRIISISRNQHDERRSLRLAVLACEPRPPYGPNEHTAQLLMDLLVQCFEFFYSSSSEGIHADKATTATMTMSLEIFDVQTFQYPRDYKVYDGFIIPGSFAAAYDSDDWILHLQRVIQTELVAHSRPTLGICFGHQVMAQSFDDGHTCPTPTGARAAKQRMQLTRAGQVLLFDGDSTATNDDAATVSNNNTLDFYCSHGDMVEHLPVIGVNLGGCDQVPIQAAAYFATANQAQSMRHFDDDATATTTTIHKPFAVTFQAHPEYATSLELGIEQTLFQCMTAMVGRGALQQSTSQVLQQDAIDSFPHVQSQSIRVMSRVCQLLGWLPAKK